MILKQALLTGALIGLGLHICPMAQATDSSGSSAAELENPILISEAAPVNFATITNDPAGDTITLSPEGVISATGASTFSGTPSAATFTITGSPSAGVSISFSTGDTITGPGAAMPLGNFTTNAGGSPGFDGSGDLSFNVGASLTINPAQVAGSYAGTYTLTVEY
jgi:hypothetical protein